MPDKPYAVRKAEAEARGGAPVCARCAACPPQDGYKTCERCRTQARTYLQDFALSGICIRCQKEPVEHPGVQRCKGCRLRAQELNRVRYMKAKADLITLYGGACVCCGEAEFAFLTLDHVNGDGAAERKALGYTPNPSTFMRRMVKAGKQDPRYQVLCFNCNCAKSDSRDCPHTKTREALLAEMDALMAPAPSRVKNGESHPRARLTAQDVLEIYARYRKGGVSQKALGEAFGTTQTTIGRIVRGESWKANES